MTEYSLLSKHLNIDETIIRNRLKEVNELVKDIEEILKERCSLLLNDLEPISKGSQEQSLCPVHE